MELKAENLILIGDQQIYVHFSKFVKEEQLSRRVFIVPGVFHWIAHLCLAISDILSDWLLSPLAGTRMGTIFDPSY